MAHKLRSGCDSHVGYVYRKAQGVQSIAGNNPKGDAITMEINITSKHFEVDDDLRQFTDAHAQKVVAEFENPKLNSVKVIFASERNWTIATVNVTGKNININAKAKADSNAKAAVTVALDRITTQLRRYLDRIQSASIKADPKTKEKIWTSQDLSESDNEFDDEI